MVLLGGLHRAVDSDPRHDFRVCEMLRAAAGLPNALIRLPPDLFQLVRECKLEAPRGTARRNAADVRLMQGVHHLAEDIELELLVRRVADAHRTRTFITRKPWELPFPEKTLTGKAIHDLCLRRTTGRSANQPIAPRRCFAIVASVHQREQCERGVAQPAIAIVPVAHASDLLGERRRRRRDDAAGWSV